MSLNNTNVPAVNIKEANIGHISKSKGHTSAQTHWTGTICNPDLKLIIIHLDAKHQLNISKHSENL